jgi:AcrR family transcriptional regulator
MPSKERENPTKGEATRLAIEDAAFSLFMEQGYHASSMRQIAERAKLALGGIYNHFASKDEIFSALIIDKHPYKQIVPSILAAEGETAEEFIRNAAQAIVTELGNRPDFMKLMFIEFVEFNGKHMPVIVGQIAPKILPVFERMVKHRKNLRSINPAILMRSFLGMVFSFYMTELLIGGTLKKFMPKNSFEQYVDVFLHGILKETE